jgi:hypothetical protein
MNDDVKINTQEEVEERKKIVFNFLDSFINFVLTN